MKFKIDNKIFEQYSSLNIGVIIAKRAKTIINELESYIEHHLRRGHKEEHIKKN